MAEVIDCGEIVVRGRTYIRDDETGRFIATVNTGAAAAVDELATRLRDMAKANIRSMMRQRTRRLAASVSILHTGSQSAEVEADSDHAAPMETGSKPHWIPNAFGRGVAVFWRGEAGRGGPPGFQFMRKAEIALNAISDSIVRKHLP
jgi:hypothetical protein